METERKPIEAERSENPSLQFIYYIHGRRKFSYDDPLFCALEDCDLILFECVGGSSKERAKLEEENNLILAGQTSFKDTITREKPLVEFVDFLEIDVQIVRRFAGSGKRFRLIDIDDTSPIYALVNETENAVIGVDSFLNLGKTDQALEKLHHLVEVAVDEIAARDECVVRQIPNLIQGFSKIAILQGGMHCRTKEIFAAANPYLAVTSHQLAITATPEIALLLKKLFGEPVDETDYRRALLADHLLLPAIAPDIWTNYEEEKIKELVNLGSKLTDNQVVDLLALFKIIYGRNLNRLTGANRHASPAEKEVYARSAFTQTAAVLLAMAQYWTGSKI